MIKRICFGFIGMMCICLACAASAWSAMQYGEAITEYTVTPMCDMFDFPEQYDGKIVTIQGIVDEESPQGDWFYLQEDECRALIQLGETDIRTEDLLGKEVLVLCRIEYDVLSETQKLPKFIPLGVEVVAQ